MLEHWAVLAVLPLSAACPDQQAVGMGLFTWLYQLLLVLHVNLIAVLGRNSRPHMLNRPYTADHAPGSPPRAWYQPGTV